MEDDHVEGGNESDRNSRRAELNENALRNGTDSDVASEVANNNIAQWPNVAIDPSFLQQYAQLMNNQMSLSTALIQQQPQNQQQHETANFAYQQPAIYNPNFSAAVQLQSNFGYVQPNRQTNQNTALTQPDASQTQMYGAPGASPQYNNFQQIGASMSDARSISSTQQTGAIMQQPGAQVPAHPLAPLQPQVYGPAETGVGTQVWGSQQPLTAATSPYGMPWPLNVPDLFNLFSPLSSGGVPFVPVIQGQTGTMPAGTNHAISNPFPFFGTTTSSANSVYSSFNLQGLNAAYPFAYQVGGAVPNILESHAARTDQQTASSSSTPFGLGGNVALQGSQGINPFGPSGSVAYDQSVSKTVTGDITNSAAASPGTAFQQQKDGNDEAKPDAGNKADTKVQEPPYFDPAKATLLAKRKYRHESFPQKLRRMIDEAERAGQANIISFSPSGQSFKIHDVRVFTNEIGPKYFRHRRFPSFRKQLSIYGFQRIQFGPEEGGFSHPLFHRDRPELIKNIKIVADVLGSRKRESQKEETKDSQLNT